MRTVSNSVYTPPIKTAVSTPVSPPPSKPATLTSPSSATSSYTSSRYSAPLRSAPATKTSFSSRFGSSSSCPGCQKNVSPMEPGVVPGPQGTRWHKTCLICGGREARGRNGRRKDGKPGCGKQLDSSAKCDAEERIWCRECLVSCRGIQFQTLCTHCMLYLAPHSREPARPSDGQKPVDW